MSLPQMEWKITFGNVITLVMCFVAVVSAYSTAQEQDKTQAQAVAKLTMRVEELTVTTVDLRILVARLEAKLDRLK